MRTSSCAPLEEIAGDTESGAGTEPAVGIDAGVGILHLLQDVFDGDESAEHAFVVDDRQFLDAMLVQDRLGGFQRRADGNGDELVLGHDALDGHVLVFDEAEVTIGQDADQSSVLGDRNAGDAVAGHDLEGAADFEFGRQRDGIGDHAALGGV